MGVLIFLLFTTVVFAQTPSRAIRIGDGFGDFDTNQLERLSNVYFSGDWSRLQKETIAVLQSLQFRGTNETALDFEKHYYSVVFLYIAPDRKEEVLRYLVHEPPPPPYESRIPGIKAGDQKKFFEIFLTQDSKDVLVSTYLSTREKSDLESQIPRFLKLFDPKVLEGLLEAVAPRNRIFAVLSRVDLPYSRATIQIEDVVQREKTNVTENFKLFNRPLTRYSFGLVSSVIASSDESGTRATIQSGDLTQDPLRGHMPMGILNIHPFPYDAEMDEISWRERFRLFVGGILAPDFGISAGAGFQLVRGFSVNAGIGVLLIDTLKEGEQIGQEPVDPQDPFEYGTGTVFFVGIGYNF
jgi:hypothetical protein